MTVYFHGNFGLNREYMAGVLRTYMSDSKATAADVAKPFGYKAPFSARYRSWLNKTGIIEAGRDFSLTPFGEVIWKNDPQLKSTATQWFLHHELTGDEERAEAWYYLGHEFLPKHESFTLQDLRDGLSMKLMPHDPKHFASGAPMIKVIARKMVQCYSQSEGLGQLGLVSESADGSFTVNSPVVLGPWRIPADLATQY